MRLPVTVPAVAELTTRPRSLAAVEPVALEMENVLPAAAPAAVLSVIERLWALMETCSLPPLWLSICWMTPPRVVCPERSIVPVVPLCSV